MALFRHGLAGLASGSGSAMEADTSKVYWYAPDSVQHTSGTISSWDDKSPNGYDLGQVGSLSMPTFNTGGEYVEFDQSSVIGLASFAFADGLRTELDGNTSDVAIFAVAYADTTSQPVDNSYLGYVFSEGETSGSNQKMYIGLRTETFGTVTTEVEFRNTLFSPAFVVASTTNSSFHDTILLIQATATQTTAAMNINDGTETPSAAVTTSNFTDNGVGLYIGAQAYSSSTALERGLLGRVYEVYATLDTSTANLDAIRAELKAKYGL